MNTSRYRINGQTVIATYLKMGGGHVLQLLVPKRAKSIHNPIREALKNQQGYGIMDDPETKSYPEFASISTGFSEIRLLDASMLWVIDTLRTQGFSATEDPLLAE